MPRLAALSIAEIIPCKSFAAGFASRSEMAFCIFRNRVRTLRFRRDRAVVWRARLEADRVLAIREKKNVSVEVRGAICLCQEGIRRAEVERITHRGRGDVVGQSLNCEHYGREIFRVETASSPSPLPAWAIRLR